MKYTKNNNYFKEVNTEDKAYFLGLLYADGWNQNNTKSKYVRISLQENDKHILDDFQKYLQSNYPIKLIDKSSNINWKNQCYIQINGKDISDDLSKLGCFQNKSLTLTFPNESQVSKNLQRHFIRGYFDGDGCVWEGQRKIVNIKDNLCKSGSRNRIIHNVKFNFTGTLNMMKNIQKSLNEDISLPINIINTSKKKTSSVQLEYSGRRQMKKFYDYLYEDANVYFKRKKKKFESIICANV